MRLPDFLIIGAQKSGTTAARNNLAKHPHVSFNTGDGPGGEVHFFDHDDKWHLGAGWYRAQFEASAPMLGEKTPNYFEPTALERIASVLPHARLLLLLRNPVERAFSQWNHLNQQPEAAGVPWRLRSFENALEEFPALLRFGHYDTSLEVLFKHFPREQVHVAIAERVLANMQRAYDNMFRFLGLEPVAMPRYEFAHRRHYPWPMRAQTRERLRDYYASRIARVSDMLGDPLPEWRGTV